MEDGPQVWQMIVGLAVLIVGLFAWLRSDIRRVETRLEARLETEIGEVKGEIGEVKGEIGEVKGEIGEVKGEIREVREEVVAVKVELGFVRGKLDPLERYIMRRNDPTAEAAE